MSIQHKYPVAETKLCWNLLGCLLIGLPPGGCISYPDLMFLLWERKVHHIQNGQEEISIFAIGLCNPLPFLGKVHLVNKLLY